MTTERDLRDEVERLQAELKRALLKNEALSEEQAARERAERELESVRRERDDSLERLRASEASARSSADELKTATTELQFMRSRVTPQAVEYIRKHGIGEPRPAYFAPILFLMALGLGFGLHSCMADDRDRFLAVSKTSDAESQAPASTLSPTAELTTSRRVTLSSVDGKHHLTYECGTFKPQVRTADDVRILYESAGQLMRELANTDLGFVLALSTTSKKKDFAEMERMVVMRRCSADTTVNATAP